MAKIIIIGGGVSGLSAGIYARLSGHEATVYESHSIPGGNLTGWDRGGYHIDNCIHWLTGTNENTETYKMWETLGVLGNVEIYRPERLYSVTDGNATVSLRRDIDRLREELLRISPADERQINKLIGAVKAAQAYSGHGGNGASALRLVPYIGLSAGGLAGRFSHPLIREFLSSFLSPGFGSLALLFVYADFCAGNADIPAGGSRAAAERMAERFKDLGGVLRTGVRVSSVEREKDRACRAALGDGTTDDGDFFIIAADPDPALHELTGAGLPRRLRLMKKDGRLTKFSAFHCAYSCGIEPPFSGVEAATDDKGQFMLREFSHEPGFAPPGKNVIQATVFCPEKDSLAFIRQSGAGYERLKRIMARRLTERIIKKHPELDGALNLIDAWTPATYKRFTGAESGCFMSYAFGPGYIPRRTGCRVPGLKNVFLATQWLMPPGGLPTAALSGKLAVDAVNALCSRKSPRRVGAESAAGG